MKELPKLFNPHELEERLYTFWDEGGYFHAERDPEKEPYTIVIPPPNVTGILHMGHGLNNTLQDVLIRYNRMKGRKTLWMPGTDHAGIATQNVVEKRLKKEGKTKHDLGRDAFVDMTWAVKEEHHAVITAQLKKIGCSLDWPRERFTLDEGLSKAVREVFVQLYEEGLIYRGKYIINYCPSCGTALANDEVEYEEKQGGLYHIKYYFKGSDRYLTIATTRPETMLGDTAVAINPADERYTDVPGDTLILPLVGREMPLIKDDYVETEFGTGALKVTPAHDPNDFMLSQKHNLDIINILNPDGTMNENVPEKYQGMDRFECRKEVIKDLEAEGFFVEKKDHMHQVGHCYRCRSVVEPYYSDQWFVKMKPLADKALAAAEKGDLAFFPPHWINTYNRWLTDIRDWCISRQLWWGHRIPVWYCDDCGAVICEKEDPVACSECGSNSIRQDTDVLDTWFSSWLWPFSTLGWPEKNDDLSFFYPTSTLVTGFDILFFWVARMIMAGIHFMGEVPFKDVYLHGLVRDTLGRKMSKSLGNGIDPIEVIDEYGADAFRFTLAFLTSLGQDVLIDKETFKMGFKFANKIWNSTRYIFSMVDDDYAPSAAFDEKATWIFSRLQNAIQKTRDALEGYRFDEASLAIYKFYWNEFCDWYIELTKKDLYAEDRERKNATLTALLTVLEESMKLLHPFMPFISEEIYQNLPAGDRDALIIETFPTYDEGKRNVSVEKEFAAMQDIIQAIRNARASFNIARSTALDVTLRYEDAFFKQVAETHMENILALSGEVRLSVVEGGTREEGTFAKVFEGAEIDVLLKGVIDMDAERARLTKEREKIAKDLAGSQKKLGNDNFVKRAKPEAVEKERGKEKEFSEKLSRIDDILSSL